VAGPGAGKGPTPDVGYVSTLGWPGQHGMCLSGNQQKGNDQEGDNTSSQSVTPGPGQIQVSKTRELRPLEPGTTTLMARNIPAKYKKDRLAQEWPVTTWSYNMLYLPCSRRGSSFGYAFLNFLTPEHAVAFQRRWHGNYLLEHGSNKHLDISQARVQGLAESLRDMVSGVDSQVWKHAACHPLVFEGTRLLEPDEVLQQFGLEQDKDSSNGSHCLSERSSDSAKSRRSLCYL